MKEMLDPTFEEADGRTPSGLEVLVMYEDRTAGLRASRSLDRLASRLGGGAELNRKLWRFDVLGLPLVREQAAVEASSVDILLLSLNSRKALPTAVQEWLHRWLDHKEERPYALGVLLDPAQDRQGTDDSGVAYAKKVAAEAGADFFCSGSEKTTADEADSFFNEIQERASRSSAVLDEILHRETHFRPR